MACKQFDGNDKNKSAGSSEFGDAAMIDRRFFANCSGVVGGAPGKAIPDQSTWKLASLEVNRKTHYFLWNFHKYIWNFHKTPASGFTARPTFLFGTSSLRFIIQKLHRYSAYSVQSRYLSRFAPGVLLLRNLLILLLLLRAPLFGIRLAAFIDRTLMTRESLRANVMPYSFK
jgi:hypothetical protein